MNQVNDRVVFTTSNSCVEVMYDESGLWDLCVIDDHWFHAALFLRQYQGKVDALSQSSWRRRYRGGPNISSFLAVSLLPVFCCSLSGLRRLVIRDFPGPQELESELGDLAKQNKVAFLVDPWNEKTDELEGDDRLLPFLESHHVPSARIAYLSFGGAGTSRRLEYFYKDQLVERGVELIEEWWLRVAHAEPWSGLFEHPRYIAPSNFGESHYLDENFLRFVRDDVAPREKWRVWEWVSQVLDKGGNLERARAAYSIGVAFSESLSTKTQANQACPVGAVYGLIGGVGLSAQSVTADQLTLGLLEFYRARPDLLIHPRDGFYLFARDLRASFENSRARLESAGVEMTASGVGVRFLIRTDAPEYWEKWQASGMSRGTTSGDGLLKLELEFKEMYSRDGSL